MPAISFCFSGYVREADVTSVTDVATGEVIDVTGKSGDEVCEKLAKGEWSLAIGDHIYKEKAEVEVFDFEAT